MPNKYSINVNKSLGSNMEKLARQAANDGVGGKLNDIGPVFRDTREKSISSFKNTCIIDMATDISITPIINSVCLVKPLDLERFKYTVRSIMLGYLNLSGGNIIA